MSRPRLVPLSRRMVPGLLAIGLFGVFAAVVFGTEFTGFASYPDVSITAAIGYSLFDFEALQADQGVPGTEPFLISFLLIAVVLDAALDASLVLATREGPDESVRPSAFGETASSPDPATEEVVDQPTATDGGQAAGEGPSIDDSPAEDRTVADSASGPDGSNDDTSGGDRR